MTKDDIIRMAEKAGWNMPNQWDETCGFSQRLEKFYEIVVAAEREARKNVRDDIDKKFDGQDFLAAIRARGEK
jgi:hypothetical protein